MDTITVRTFFLWCTIINGAILIGTSVIFVFASDWAYQLHNRFLNIPKETSKTVFYSFIGLYKMLWIVFNLVPYIALLIIG